MSDLLAAANHLLKTNWAALFVAWVALSFVLIALWRIAKRD